MSGTPVDELAGNSPKTPKLMALGEGILIAGSPD